MRLLKCSKEWEVEGKILSNPSNCCTRTLGSARRPPARVMWSAEQHIMNIITVNFGPPVMPVQNFTGTPYGVTDVSANNIIREPNTFTRNVL